MHCANARLPRLAEHVLICMQAVARLLNTMQTRQVFTPDPECAVRHRLYGTFKVSRHRLLGKPGMCGKTAPQHCSSLRHATHAQHLSDEQEACRSGRCSHSKSLILKQLTTACPHAGMHALNGTPRSRKCESMGACLQVKYMALNEAQFQEKFKGMFVSPDRAAELLKEARGTTAVLRSLAQGH